MVLRGPSHRASVTGGPASPEGTLGLPENATIYPSSSRPAPGWSMKNRSQDRGRARSHPPACRGWPSLPVPFPKQTSRVSPARPGGDRGRGGGERAGRGAWTDSWPRHRGAGVAGGRGLGSNFPEKQPTCSRNDSKRWGKKSSVTTSKQRTRKVFFKWARLFLCLFKTLKPCSKRGCVRWSLPHSLPHPRPRRHGREV